MHSSSRLDLNLETYRPRQSFPCSHHTRCQSQASFQMRRKPPLQSAHIQFDQNNLQLLARICHVSTSIDRENQCSPATRESKLERPKTERCIAVSCTSVWAPREDEAPWCHDITAERANLAAASVARASKGAVREHTTPKSRPFLSVYSKEDGWGNMTLPPGCLCALSAVRLVRRRIARCKPHFAISPGAESLETERENSKC